jgi:hypothetical protein
MNNLLPTRHHHPVWESRVRENGDHWRTITPPTDYNTALEGLRRYMLDEGMMVCSATHHYTCTTFKTPGYVSIMAVIERPTEEEENAP